MRNAKEELLASVAGMEIICASIQYGCEYSDDQKVFILKQYHSQNDYEHFLQCLNFSYDNGYGGQELFGTVWLDNGRWLERGEYDGSEWWELREYPEIPEELK